MLSPTLTLRQPLSRTLPTKPKSKVKPKPQPKPKPKPKPKPNLIWTSEDRQKTLKEIVVYRDPPVVHIYDVVEHGRRFYSTLVFSTDAKWCTGLGVGHRVLGAHSCSHHDSLKPKLNSKLNSILNSKLTRCHKHPSCTVPS